MNTDLFESVKTFIAEFSSVLAELNGHKRPDNLKEFIEKKIPAVTIHGMSNNWSNVLHTGNDQASKVNAMSVYLGYRLTLAMIARVSTNHLVPLISRVQSDGR